MVVEVLPHARQVGLAGDAVFGEVIGRADARQHQKLGRVDGAAGQDDLAVGAGGVVGAAAAVRHAADAVALDGETACQRAVDDGEVGPAAVGTDVGLGGGGAHAVVDVLLEDAEAFLKLPVDVVGQRRAHLLAGAQEGLVEFAGQVAVADMDRAGAAAPGGFAALPGL